MTSYLCLGWLTKTPENSRPPPPIGSTAASALPRIGLYIRLSRFPCETSVHTVYVMPFRLARCQLPQNTGDFKGCSDKTGNKYSPEMFRNPAVWVKHPKANGILEQKGNRRGSPI